MTRGFVDDCPYYALTFVKVRNCRIHLQFRAHVFFRGGGQYPGGNLHIQDVSSGTGPSFVFMLRYLVNFLEMSLLEFSII